MSRLKLYAPAPRDPAGVTLATLADSDVVPSRRWPGRAAGTISFARAAAELRPRSRPAGRRVNATCPDCGAREARAVTLNDATVVGHRCGDCGREWPVVPRAEGCG